MGIQINESILFDSSKALNNIGVQYYLIGDYQKAEEFYLASYRLKSKIITDKNSIEIANSLNNLSSIKILKWDYDSALILLQKAISIYDTQSGLFQTKSLINTNMGLTYKYIGDFSLAEQYYRKALLSIENLSDNASLKRKAQIYNRIGNLEDSRGNYLYALDYLKKGINLISTRIDPNLYYYHLINIAEVQIKLKKYEESTNTLNKAMQIIKKYDLAEYNLTTIYKCEANICNHINNSQDAFAKLDLLSDLYAKLKVDSLFYFEVFMERSTAFKNLKDYPRASEFLNKSLDLLVQKQNTASKTEYLDDIKAIDLYKNMGDLYFEWYTGTADKEKLKLATDALKKATSLVESVKASFLTIESKFFLAENEAGIYNQGLYYSYLLYSQTKDETYIDDAFFFAEKSKSSVLMASIQEQKAKNFGNIPDSLISKEQRLKKEIGVYKGLIYEENLTQFPDSSKLKIWENYLFSFTQEYEQLKQFLEKNFTEYYKFKYQQNSPSIAEIQTILKKSDMVIEQALSDSIIYLFTISKQAVNLEIRHVDDTFTGLVSNLLNDFKNFSYLGQGTGAYNDYQQHAYAIYEKLFDRDKIKAFKHLIIIPDGILSYLPFEALVTDIEDNPQSFQDLNYLIHNFSISYSYSAGLLTENKQNSKRNFLNRILAVAPEYINVYTPDNDGFISDRNYRDLLRPLPFALKEVEELSSFVLTKSLVKGEATEDRFLQYSGKFNILHLAMHTLIDDNNPMYSKLVFTKADTLTGDGFVTTSDIFSLSLKASMTVLSACSSGEGEFKKGEGVLSLARGFFYAGCPSLVMTLWQVEDESGLLLMKTYYKYLKKGYSKDRAMQKAKIEYLNTIPPQRQHPFYWSSYICIGNPNAIYYPRWIYLVFAVLLIYLTSKFLKRKKTRIKLKPPAL